MQVASYSGYTFEYEIKMVISILPTLILPGGKASGMRCQKDEQMSRLGCSEASQCSSISIRKVVEVIKAKTIIYNGNDLDTDEDEFRGQCPEELKI